MSRAGTRSSRSPMRPRCIADLTRSDVGVGDFAAQCHRAKALGLDSVLIALPDAGEHAQEQWVEARVQTATRSGVSTLIAFEMNRVPADAAIVASHPAWFRSAAADTPDPRRETNSETFAANQQVLVRGVAGDAFEQWWLQRLQRWIALGVAGFSAIAPAASFWRSAIPQIRAHGVVWIAASTVGLGASDVAALEGIGFDAAFSSFAWWDGQAAWFYEEDARLQRIAAQIIAVLPASSDPVAPAFAARLQPQLAAALADGMLVEPSEQGTAADDDIRAATAVLAARASSIRTLRPLLRSRRTLLAVLIQRHAAEPAAELWLGNLDSQHVAVVALPDLLAQAGVAAEGLIDDSDDAVAIDAGSVALQPNQTLRWRIQAVASVEVRPPAPPSRERASAARIAIEAVTPMLDGGRFAVKRCLADRVSVAADIFADGHDHLAAAVAWRCVDSKQWQRQPLRHLGNDRWGGEFSVDRIGRHEFFIEAWRDDFATLRDEIDKKQRAGVLTALDLADARALLLKTGDGKRAIASALQSLLREFDTAVDDAARARLIGGARVAQIVAAANQRPFLTRSATLPIDVERIAARYASWYELFPRSLGKPGEHGSFDDVIAQLPRIRAMGFDVLYMPPIHPIGSQHRKGKNNSLHAAPGEPGSPYAIGSSEGGHDEVHAQLGGIDAFRRLLAAASAQGLELALDFAVQCSPDHPWLAAHPDWFDHRADGSIRHAENPPKKYEDIVNVDFYAADAIPALWESLRDVVLFWADEGVRLFRVDNPHTKPLPFWEWLIASVRSRHPDTIFLSEAFTRPKPMYRLAKLGFSQSYTYFIWRNDKQGLREYLRELNQGEPRECFRPHLFVNTPDINPYFLQNGGRPAHLIRAALAATLSGLWGVYCGFELCEASALPGREEYLDSEKYQLREWDWDRPGNIVAEITRLNLLRRCNPELQTHLDIEFLHADNDQVLYFAKGRADAAGAVLVAISLDPRQAQASAFEVPLWRWGLADDAAIGVEDLWDGNRFVWHGKRQYVELDPSRPFALWRIDAGGAAPALAAPTTLDGGHPA
jgi:starch synthase (maltosyl-transferring)